MARAESHSAWESVVQLGLSTAVLWAIAQLLFSVQTGGSTLVAAFINGWLVCFYASLICFSVPERRFFLAGAVAGVLGLLHPFWCLAGAAALGRAVWALGPGLLGGYGPEIEGPLMFTATGLGFTIPVAIASRSWRITGAMLGATAMSTVVAGISDSAALRGFDTLGVGAAPLHLAIAACLATAAIHQLRHPRDRTRCAHCAYSLAGLPFDCTCPECGHPRLGDG